MEKNENYEKQQRLKLVKKAVGVPEEVNLVSRETFDEKRKQNEDDEYLERFEDNGSYKIFEKDGVEFLVEDLMDGGFTQEAIHVDRRVYEINEAFMLSAKARSVALFSESFEKKYNDFVAQKEWTEKIKKKYDEQMLKDLKGREEYAKQAEIVFDDQQLAESIREKKTYRHAKITDEERLKATIGREKLGSAYAAISKEMKDAYAYFDKIKGDENGVEAKLHHSAGTNLFNEGHNVLEFTVGGSSFVEGLRHEASGIRAIDDEDSYTYKRSQEEVDKLHLMVYGKERNFKTINSDFDEKKISGIRYKERTRGEGYDKCIKRKISIPGVHGALNRGDFSIENSRTYIRLMGAEYLTPIFKSWKEQIRGGKSISDLKDVHVIMQGHSRGAVTVTLGAMSIRGWIGENYPEFLSKVKFDLIAHEPVPGTGSDSLYKHEVDLKHKIGGDTTDQLKEIQYHGNSMLPLEDCGNTTVFYALLSKKGWGVSELFRPMKLKGAQRIILTTTGHESVLQTVDETQYKDKNGNKSTKEKAHNCAMTDASTGEVYRSSGINDLPPGVYFLDELGALVKMENAEQVMSLMDKLNIEKKELNRAGRIKEVVHSYFEDQKKEEDLAKIQKEKETTSHKEKIINMVNTAKNLMKNVDKYNADEKKKSDSYRLVFKKMAALLTLAENYDSKGETEEYDKSVLDAAADTLCAATAYIESHSRYHFTKSGDDRLALVKGIANDLTEAFARLDTGSQFEFVRKIKLSTKKEKDKDDDSFDFKTTNSVCTKLARKVSGNPSLSSTSLDIYFADKLDKDKTEQFINNANEKYSNTRQQTSEKEIFGFIFGKMSNEYDVQDVAKELMKKAEPKNVMASCAELSHIVNAYKLLKPAMFDNGVYKRSELDDDLLELGDTINALEKYINEVKKYHGIENGEFIKRSIKGYYPNKLESCYQTFHHEAMSVIM